METIVPGPEGPECVPGLLAFAPASPGRRTGQKCAQRGWLLEDARGGGAGRQEGKAFKKIVICLKGRTYFLFLYGKG